MAARVSRSLLDPVLTQPLRSLYPRLGLPRRLPPEAIVLAGNAAAVGAAVCFALVVGTPWLGLVGAALVAAYHFADVFDGQHARATGQCRNGGELLDHFCDPVSLSCIAAGWAFAADAPLLAVPAVLLIMAKGLLANLTAKLGGDFEVGRFGPTEFKAGLAVLLLAAAVVPAGVLQPALWWGFVGVLAVTAVSFPFELVRSIKAVNRSGVEADTSEWVLAGEPPA